MKLAKHLSLLLALLLALPCSAGRTFNGTTDKASAPGTGTPDDITGTVMSFSCWFMLTSAPGNEITPCAKWNSSNAGGYMVNYNQSGFAGQSAGVVYITIPSNHFHFFFCTNTINLNQWYVVSFVYQNNLNMKVWLGTNGVSTLCGTDNTVGTTGTMVSSGGNIVFGAANAGRSGSLATTGKIAEVGVWNVRLSDGEAQSLATVCPSAVRPTALVGYWPLTGASGASIEPDLSGNGQNATLTGTATANHPPCSRVRR